MRFVLGLVFVLLTALPAAGADCDDADPFPADLADTLADRYPNQRFTAAVYDQRDGCLHTFLPERRITTASVFKIEVLAGVLWRAEKEGRSLTDWEMDRAVPMITESANPPTSDLFLSLGGVDGFDPIHRAFGLTDTEIPSSVWGRTITSAEDQIHLVRQVLLGEFGPLEIASIEVAGDLMGSVIPSQTWGITAGIPSRWDFELKNGFFPTEGIGWRINSVGVIYDIDGNAYAMAILSDGWSAESTGIDAVEGVAEILNESLVPRSAPRGIPFVDVGTSDWFYETVRWAYQEEVVRGTSPTTFSPFDGVTRGQAAAVLTRFLDLPPATGDHGFTDVSDSVFAEDIAALVEAGITRGCNPPDNDRFCSERTLIRGEMAAMLVRALQLEHQGGEDRFTDDDTSVFEEDLETLAHHELVLGCNPPQNDRACPGSTLIRAEIVTILERIP